jgi:Cys-tRNA synthase (O-phospho-L-seryl-tRNA:Cys-tRNA synthase)
MNVSQLIEILQTYSPDMRVIIDGYEYGYEDVKKERIKPVFIVLDAHGPESYINGPHSDNVHQKGIKELALLIERCQD